MKRHLKQNKYLKTLKSNLKHVETFENTQKAFKKQLHLSKSTQKHLHAAYMQLETPKSI